MNVPEQPPRDLKQACRIPAYAKALSELIHRAHERDVFGDLIQSGMDSESARRVIENSKLLLDETKAGPGNLMIAQGLVCLIPGALITAYTLFAASEAGGYFVVCYGAIIAGVIMIGRGISMKRYPDLSVAHKELDVAMRSANEEAVTTLDPSVKQYDY